MSKDKYHTKYSRQTKCFELFCQQCVSNIISYFEVNKHTLISIVFTIVQLKHDNILLFYCLTNYVLSKHNNV